MLVTSGAVERSRTGAAPVQQTMDMQMLHSMSPEQVGQLFASKGFTEYSHLFQQHNINGHRLLLLTPDDLREMGVNKIGDRLGMQHELSLFKSTARTVMRSSKIEEHEQVYPHNTCRWLCDTCCGLCPPQMDHYTLGTMSLKITHTYSPTVCGRRCSCLGVRVENDVHPLTQIVDVDTTNVQNGCLAVAMTQITCHLTPMSQGDTVGGRESEGTRKPTAEMVVPFRVGEAFAAQIRNQIEECKRNPSFISK